MDAPTPAEIRAISPWISQQLPYDASDDPDALQLWIDEATALICSITCRIIGTAGGQEEMPTEKIPLARRAIALKIEQMYQAMGTAQNRRRGFSSGKIRSFSAGNYSESYFGPEDARKAGMLDPDPRFAEILWALTTDDCREYWLNIWDPSRPHEAVAFAMPFNWGDRPGGY